MWLATILVCATLEATSCDVISQPKKLYITEQECNTSVEAGILFFSSTNVYISGGCVKIGETV